MITEFNSVHFYSRIGDLYLSTQVFLLIGEKERAGDAYFDALTMVETIAIEWAEGNFVWCPQTFLSNYPEYRCVFTAAEERENTSAYLARLHQTEASGSVTVYCPGGYNTKPRLKLKRSGMNARRAEV